MLPLQGFHVGPLRLSAYGACASVGVLVATALSGRAARWVHLPAEATWDAGVVAVICCFAASRLLLVLSDPKAFTRYPMLVLSLPSLTFVGMALAALLVWMHLRRKRLPVLPMLDAFAPCGAVLAIFLELGHLLDGSEPGMPVFQGMPDKVTRLVPVSLYGMVLAAVLSVVLWMALEKGRMRYGRVAALGLMLGGALAFGLDMLSLPLEIGGEGWLEPGEVVALCSMLAGAAMWNFASETKPVAGEQQALRGTVTPEGFEKAPGGQSRGRWARCHRKI